MTQASLASFDGTVRSTVEVVRPDRYRALEAALQSYERIIVRGAGLSYAQASVGARACTIIFSEFNRLLEFDAEAGTIEVEGGVTLGKVLEFCIGQGYYLPVLPGHPSISVGGCIGFDVHGKSQTHSGTFREQVEDLVLLHPDLGEIYCSRNVNQAIFDLTVGGMGLTGVIVRARLRLVPLQGNGISVEKQPVANLVDAVAVMKERKQEFSNIYSWHNVNLQGSSFGAGVVYAERFVRSEAAPVEIKSFNSKKSLEFRIGPLWNSFSIPLMCKLYYLKERLALAPKVHGLLQGSFPLNGKEIYFNFFGRRGFREYQLIVDFESWPFVVSEVQKLIRRHSVQVSLCSLKLFKGSNRYLSFCKTGVCLSLDVAADQKALPFFDALDELLATVQGIPNISKDSRLKATTVQKLFSEYEMFKNDLLNFDPKMRFWSELRERLGIY